MDVRKPLVIIAGPTAVGKSRLAIELAGKIGGEIISADSMQVYEYMDIGSAKLTRPEMSGIEHYLIDVLKPWEEFNVVSFSELADEALKTIYKKGKIPIIAGGTGFYIQAALYDIDFTEASENKELRARLLELANKEGNDALSEVLRRIDPEAASAIHPNNIKRVIRAIEFYVETGERISEHNKRQRARTSPYNFAYFVIKEDRALLYERIERRVDKMIKLGLVDEVRSLKEMGCKADMVSMQGLGYKEIFEYLNGECTLEDVVYRIKRDTRRFAKRQLTWFGHEPGVIYLDRRDFRKNSVPEDLEEENRGLLEFMLNTLEEKRITAALNPSQPQQ